MRKKTNIYDSDDADRSKRLSFTPEERAARAQQKAEVLGQKLERAEKQIPKKKKIRLQKELDPEKSRMKHTLRFEEVEKQRGKEILPKKAGRRMVQTASAAVHSKMYQVEEENVSTKAAHRTELATEATATMAAHAAVSIIRTPLTKRWKSCNSRSIRLMSMPPTVPLSGITRNCRPTM